VFKDVLLVSDTVPTVEGAVEPDNTVSLKYEKI
jgi:hypothetical protein